MVELLFHIALAEDWGTARTAGRYEVSTRGRLLAQVGYVHLSHRHQVERVANAYYRDAGPLLLLVIDPDRLHAEIKEDRAGGAETFPHLYGPLPISAVVDVSPLEPALGGWFVPRTSWLSTKLAVAPSSIEGLGLLATASIGAGEVVAVMGGQVLSDSELARVIAGKERYSAAAIDGGVHVLQDPDDPLTRGNHSCDPNLWMVDELGLAARRAIGPGEEATVDYALATAEESWSMACRCATSSCRRVIRGSDWRRPELQERYRGHFSPFIERWIARQQESSQDYRRRT